jgi:hypothetical protein
MAVVEPPQARSRIEETVEGLTITIPGNAGWGVGLLVTVWLAGWAAGEVFVILRVRKEIATALAHGGLGHGEMPPAAFAFVAVWLLLWTFGGLMMLFAWMNMVLGGEVVRVDAQGISRSWHPLPFPRPRRYLAAHIVDLRAAPTLPRSWEQAFDWRRWSEQRGAVAFDYGAKTVRVAGQVEEPEGRQIVAAMLRRFPALGKQDEAATVQCEKKW